MSLVKAIEYVSEKFCIISANKIESAESAESINLEQEIKDIVEEFEKMAPGFSVEVKPVTIEDGAPKFNFKVVKNERDF